MQPILNYIKHPASLMDSLVKNCGQWLPDSVYLKLRYRFQMGKRLNLNTPKTFNEKLQWLKLYDRNPEYTKLVDKILVKDYVAHVLGPEYVVPLLGVWDTPEEIDWDSLPNRFVLKTNHSGGNTGVVICKNKDLFDRQEAICRLNSSLKEDVYRNLREWPYRDVKKRVFAEQYIDPAPNVTDLTDYKWFCFNGEPQYCQVIQDRSSIETIDFFDTEWNHQEFVGLNPTAGPAAVTPLKPFDLDIQIRLARELSKGIPFSRIDLYETDSNTYFGEITFYPASGIGTFSPECYNEILGRMLVLPGEKWGEVIIRQLHGNIQVEKLDLNDYKFFCFNGVARCFKIDFDRQSNHHANYYDRNGSLLPFGEKAIAPVPEKKLSIPSNYFKMIELAEKIAQRRRFVRVDFYNVSGRIYFGEITFYPAGGMGQFTPDEWDETLGTWLQL